MGSCQKGFTLTEVALASAIGVMLVAASVQGFDIYKTNTNQDKSRLILAAVRDSIQTYKQRCGVFPPLVALTNNNMANNGGACDVADAPFYGEKPGPPVAGGDNFPKDPFYLNNVVILDNALVGPTPVTIAPGPGGWLYNEIRGVFKINLSDVLYGQAGTVKKLESNPSTW